MSGSFRPYFNNPKKEKMYNITVRYPKVLVEQFQRPLYISLLKCPANTLSSVMINCPA